MDAQNTEIEIDLVRLFKFILSKWKVLLVSGVILSVLAFSYKFYGFNYSKVPLAQINKLFDIERLEKQPDGRVVKQKVKVSYELYKEDYESRLSAYENKKADIENKKNKIQNEIRGLNKELLVEEEYTKGSLLYKMSSDTHYQSEYFIDIEDKRPSQASGLIGSVNSNTKQEIANSTSASSDTAQEEKLDLDSIQESRKPKVKISNFITSESRAISLAEKMIFSNSSLDELSQELKVPRNLSSKAINELIEFNSENGKSIELIIKADSKEHIDALEKYIISMISKLKEEIGDVYFIKYKVISSGLVSDDTVASIQKDENAIIADIKSEINRKKDELSSLVQPVPLEDKFIELSSYKIQKYIIFILASLFGGIFISSCVYGAKYLFEGKLRDKNYLKDLYNLRLLGCLHESSYSQLSTAEKDKFTELVKVLVQGTKTIAVSSSLEENTIEDTVSIIRDVALNNNVEVKVITDENMSEITNCDGVIVVEKLDVSDLNKSLDNLEVLKGFNVNLLGLALA